MKHNWKRNSSLSTLFISSHLNIPHNTFSNRQKVVILLLQNEIVPLTTSSSQVSLGKIPPSIQFSYIYTKEKLLGFPQMTLGIPQRFTSHNFLTFSAYIIYNILQLNKLIKHLGGGPCLIVQELLPCWSFWGNAFELRRFEKMNIDFKFSILISYYFDPGWAQA